jgi:hypothetical protein
VAKKDFRWPQVDAFLKAAGKLSPAQWKTVHRRTRRAEPKFRRIGVTRQLALARMRAAEAPSTAAERRLHAAYDHYEDIATDIRALQAHDSRKHAVAFVMTLRFAVHEVVLAHTIKPWLEGSAPGQGALLLFCGLFDGLVPRSVLPYPSTKEQGSESSQRLLLRPDGWLKAAPTDTRSIDQLASSWRAVATSVKARGGAAKRIAIGKPAPEASVRKVEKEIGAPIPVSFRKILRTVASRAHFEWRLPDEPSDERAEFAYAAGFAPPTYGMISWDLSSLARLEQQRQGWAEISSTPRVWRNKLPFHGLSNGDLLAIDLRSGSVVYLDHDEGPMHGRRLGASFESFVGVFTSLGCPGPEAWELEPFLNTRGITTNAAGATWVAWLHDRRS